MHERLQKILARGGIASRRASESLIVNGRVSVNGRVVTELGTRADPEVDVVAVDGLPLAPTAKHSYLMLNKPAGYVTTRHDPEGRPTVYELVPDIPGLFSVGRLDIDSEGLLLLTTDGAWAEQVAHPRFEVEREYEVRVGGAVIAENLARLREGIMLDGKPARPLAVRLSGRSGSPNLLTIVMLEGRKREVRMLCAAAGLRVRQLVRRRLGPILLGWLGSGHWRSLNSREVEALLAPPRHGDPADHGGQTARRVVEHGGHGEAATRESERMRRHRWAGGVGQVDDRQAPGGRAGLRVPRHRGDVSGRDEPGARARH